MNLLFPFAFFLLTFLKFHFKFWFFAFMLHGDHAVYSIDVGLSACLDYVCRDTSADKYPSVVGDSHRCFAEGFFAAVPSIREKMTALRQVGLGYIKVGQQATTLSGGEAQRVKLSKELSKRATGRTLYILDEPTTGLHFEDVRKLMEVLHELVEQGNSVVVIEHNLDVIKTADWIIDIGPEGGDGGGRIVATGTPEQVAEVAESHTGRYLKGILAEAAKRRVAAE